MRMHLIRLYIVYVVLMLKWLMEYRINFFLDFLALLMNNVVAYLTVWIIMERFSTIDGWTYYEVMTLVSLYMIAWGFCGLFIRSPLLMVEKLVEQGKFDNVLTKPILTLLVTIQRSQQ